VTNLVMNTLVMCAGLIFTLSLSSATVSVLRTLTPRNVRMMVETLIIGFYVIIVDVLLGRVLALDACESRPLRGSDPHQLHRNGTL